MVSCMGIYIYIYIFNLMDTITCVGGSYVQYDTIAYPCEAIMGTKSSKGVDAGVKDSARSWLQLPTAIKAIAEKAWSFVAGTSEGQIAAELSTGTVATASSEGQILLPHKEEHTYSLFAYLTPYSEALCSGAYSTNLVEMAEEVMHIYTLMNHVQISTNKGVKKESLHMSQVTLLCMCVDINHVHDNITNVDYDTIS